ncbi:hypothetical protein DFR30_2239 [Thiogranum longum]|uniref:Carboxypeptidase family protein n=1 Tax=Thiogranum longum TaxID=1537524 RepID=A0A4R1HE03_9GAMM|nr:carboxypeptidase-like regulatory domain-containing protein [Thiogranum longum]TCK18951.1 hypothetical protein DFR30_2239 [Thiogranum longum]
MAKRNFLWACIVLLLGQLLACSGIPRSHWPAIEGRVLDKDTGQPVGDALVVALWKGVGGYSRRMCFHAETVKTDENGVYRIPSWFNKDLYSPYFDRQHIELVPYKAGFNYVGGVEGIQYLKKFEGSSSERIATLNDYKRLTSCYIKDVESKRNIYIKDLALCEEAKKVAITAEDKYHLIGFLYNVEVYEFGSKLATQRALKRASESEYELPECSSTTSIRTGCRYKVPEE